MTLVDFIHYSDTYAPAGVLLLCFLKRNSLPKLSFLFIGYLFVSIITFGSSNWLAATKTNNLFLYHFYTAFNFYFFYLYIFIPVGNKSRIILTIFSIFFTIFLITNYFLWEPLDAFNTNSSIVSFLLLIFFSVIYFLNLIESNVVIEIKRNFSFWIVTGVLFYSSTCTFVYFFYKYDKNINATLDDFLWLIQDVATIIKFILFSFGIIWYHRKPIYHG